MLSNEILARLSISKCKIAEKRMPDGSILESFFRLPLWQFSLFMKTVLNWEHRRRFKKLHFASILGKVQHINENLSPIDLRTALMETNRVNVQIFFLMSEEIDNLKSRMTTTYFSLTRIDKRVMRPDVQNVLSCDCILVVVMHMPFLSRDS